MPKGRKPQEGRRFVGKAEAEASQLRLAASSAWGEWLASLPWDHFGTLTFDAGNPSEETATRLFRRWVRRLEQRAQRAVGWFHVVEKGAGGMVHLHALVLGTSRLAEAALKSAWSWGRADVPKYDRRRGGSHYVTKALGSGEAYDIHLPIRLAKDGRAY